MDKATTDLGIPVGAPNWMDLLTDQVDAATEFYESLFGWTAEDTPPQFGGYKLFTKDGQAVGGCMYNDPKNQIPNNWSIYLKSDDATKICELTKANNGEVVMEPLKVENNGTLAILRDPSGAVIGTWQPDLEMGFGKLYEAGTPVHFELLSNDYDKAVPFYEAVFGWTPHVVANEANFRYSAFSDETPARAGIMDASIFDQACQNHWSVYVASDSASETAAKAESLGATILAPAEETPYGTLATIQDPTGAVFKVRS